SANLTSNGYARNLELSVRLEAVEAEQQASVRDVLRQQAREVPLSEWRAFVAAVRTVKLDEAEQADPDSASPMESGRLEKPTHPTDDWQEFVGALLSERAMRGIR